MVKQKRGQYKFLQAVILHIFSHLIHIPFAEIKTCKKLANVVYQYFRCIYLPFSFATPFAEIKTYRKPANAVFQNFNHLNYPFSFAGSFAKIPSFANKYKPVYLVVNAVNTLFLCKASLQKP